MSLINQMLSNIKSICEPTSKATLNTIFKPSALIPKWAQNKCKAKQTMPTSNLIV